MRKVRTHKFNGVRYHIELDPILGRCDKPDTPAKCEYPAIVLPAGLPCGDSRSAKVGMVTLIHECLHAENWWSQENTVDRVATDIGNLLWKLGYRRQKK